jgi:hypothetical protein
VASTVALAVVASAAPRFAQLTQPAGQARRARDRLVMSQKFWPWLNFRIGLQYTHWSKFNGASTNIDGMGRSSQADNTLFLYVWTAF